MNSGFDWFGKGETKLNPQLDLSLSNSFKVKDTLLTNKSHQKGCT